MKLENAVAGQYRYIPKNDNPKSYDAVNIRKIRDNDPELKFDFENSQHGFSCR